MKNKKLFLIILPAVLFILGASSISYADFESAILINPCYYRDAATGSAEITAVFKGRVDSTNQALSWSLPAEAKAVKDLSFGQKSKISFLIDKPGNYNISASVVEPTNPEDKAFKIEGNEISKAVSHFTVDNLAPVLKPAPEIKNLDLMLINNSESSSGLYKNLMKFGLISNIHNVEIDRDKEPGLFNQQAVLQATSHTNCDPCEFWEDAQNIDEKYYFRFLTNSASGYIFNGPFYVYRYSLGDLSREPDIFTVPENYFQGSNNRSTGCIGYDLQGEYLYINLNNKCLIMDKETGYFYPIINKSFAKTNIIAAGGIYSLCSDGVYKINPEDSSYECVMSGSCIINKEQSARVMLGKALFIFKESNKIYLCKMNLKTAEISKTFLFESTDTEYLTASTPKGNFFINSKSSSAALLRGFNENGAEIITPLDITLCKLALNSAAIAGVNPVYDNNGEVNYVYTASITALGTPPTVDIYSLYHSYSASFAANRAAEYSKPLLGIEKNDGTVIIAMGSSYSKSSQRSFCNCYYFSTKGNPIAYPNPQLNMRLEWSFKYNDYYVLSLCYQNSNTIYIYNFSEDSDRKADRLALQLLCSDYDCIERTEIADAGYIANGLGIEYQLSQGQDIPVLRYKAGETVSCSDFGLNISEYEDYEKDYPLTECNSLSLPQSFNICGEYQFSYWVIDETGREDFNYASEKRTAIFYVDPADGPDDPGTDDPGENENPGEKPRGLKRFILHRKY